MLQFICAPKMHYVLSTRYQQFCLLYALCTGSTSRTNSFLSAGNRCFINIQKDANERKPNRAGGMNVAIYMCTKVAVCFEYVDTNNSVCSWHIFFVNHVLWYVNGNADILSAEIALTNIFFLFLP